MEEHIKIRIRFEKSGALRFIGHLDVMRFFQKCNRRASIDVCYTGGFSPHQIMSFASPLSVGLESKGEYMDLEVASVTSSKDMILRYNKASVPQIKIVSVKRLPKEAGNAMASVQAASYDIRFREGRMPSVFACSPESIQEKLEAYLSKEDIPYRKEGKNGERFVNLRPGIYEFSWNASKNTCFMLLDASSGGNVKPIQVLETFLQDDNETLQDNALLITRLDLYTKTADGASFLSLDEVGEEII